MKIKPLLTETFDYEEENLNRIRLKKISPNEKMVDIELIASIARVIEAIDVPIQYQYVIDEWPKINVRLFANYDCKSMIDYQTFRKSIGELGRIFEAVFKMQKGEVHMFWKGFSEKYQFNVVIHDELKAHV